VLPGEATDETNAALDHVTEQGAIVPSLWHLEIANVLLMAERRSRISRAQRSRAIGAFAALPIMIDVETTTQAWGRTLDLAVEQGLTLYDATYLELALRTGLPLATLDRELKRAATLLGMPNLIF